MTKASPKTTRRDGRLTKNQREAERKIVITALRKFHGHNTEAAAWLGICRRALFVKIRDHGLGALAVELRTEAGIMGPRKVEESI